MGGFAVLWGLGSPALQAQIAAEENEVTQQVEADKPAEEPGEISDTGEAAAEAEPSGLLGPVRIGPMIGLGVPHPYSWGLDVMYKRVFTIGVSAGKFSSDHFDPVEVQLVHWDVRARWHPWWGSFFLGLAVGQQELFGEAKKDVSFSRNGVKLTVPVTVQVEFATTYLTPHLGWTWIWDCGFNMGFDFGAQIPIQNKSELKVGFENVAPSQETAVKETSEYKKLEKDVDDAGDLIGKTVLPYITLLRLGWLFKEITCAV